MMRPSSTLHGPLSNRFKTTLTYVDNLTMNPAVGSAASHLFSCNSLFDPDVTGVGHQPRGFDQMMQLYKHYHVIGSKIEVQISPSDTGINPGLIFGIANRESSVASETSIIEYIEQGNCIYRNLYMGGGALLPKFIMKWKPSTLNAVKNVLDEGSLSGTVSSSPTKGANWHLFAVAADGTDYPVLTFVVKISYICIFTSPTDLGAS